jgi:gamma-tubulin complex component 2
MYFIIFVQFLVEDNHVETEGGFGSIEDCDGYWEKRYMVRRERVPSFLGQHTDKILRTGKYLNVIRQCGEFNI